MNKTLKFYGASDNQIYAGPIGNVTQYDNGTCDGCEAHAGRFLVATATEALCVHVVYAGSWAFAVTTENEADDFETMPAWVVRRSFGTDVAYSETLEIDVPAEAVLKWLE